MPRRRLLPAVPSICCFALGASIALAQAQEPPPKPAPPEETPAPVVPPEEGRLRSDLGTPKVERGKAGPELVVPVPTRHPSGATAKRRLPDLPDAAPSGAQAAEPSREPAPEKERLSIAEAPTARLVESLATRKRVDDDEGRRICAELGARGDAARAALRGAVATKRADALQALAELLFAIADEGDLELLHRRAMQGLTASSAKFFAAAFLTAEPERSDWVLAWFDAANPNLRAEAERRAIELRLPAEPFRARLSHVHPDVRRRALHLLAQLGDAQLGATALALFDDDYEPTAQACMALLIAHGGAAEWDALRTRFRGFAYDRAWGRAAAALLEREAARAESELTLADLPGCEAAFAHPDAFVASAAAAVVGAVALRCDDERASLWLRERVPHLLVRGASGDVGHPDLPLLRPSLLRLLRRMSGLDLGQDGTAWKLWWGRVGGSFAPRREFFSLDPAALGELEVRYIVDDGDLERERCFALQGPAVLAATELPMQRRWLEPEAMQSLFDAIVESGIARAEWLAGRMGEAGAPKRSIELRRGETTKLVECGPGVEHPRWEALCAALEQLDVLTAWQPYLDRDRYPHWGAFRESAAPAWALARTDAERRALLRGLVATAIDDLDPALAAEAYWTLERALPSGEHLEPEPRDALLDFIGAGASFDPLRRALLELVAKRADAETLERLKTFFALRPARYEERLVLGELLAAAGPDAVRAALADARPPVLAGAAEAAHVLTADPPLLRLVELLSHSTLQVRLASLHTLGRLGVEEACSPLLERFERGEMEERLEAAEALARLSASRSAGMLARALAGDDALLRRAIFAGFEASDSLSAALALASFAVGRGAAHADGLRARTAFLDKPLDQIRSVCRSLAESPETLRAAALLWAEALDASALPVLVAVLEEAPEDLGVIQGITWLTCRSFTPATALSEARRFAEEHAAETPQDWFARACEEAGLGLPEPAGMLRVSPSRGTLEALCRVLAIGTPELRMHAARYLREALREDFGYVTLSTDVSACERIANAYRDLLRAGS